MATSRPSAQTDEKGIDDNESHPGNSDADRRRPARPRLTGNTPDVRKSGHNSDNENNVGRHRETGDSPRPGTIGTPVVTVPHSRFAPSPHSRSVFLPQDHSQAGLVSSHTTVSLGIPTIQFHQVSEMTRPTAVVLFVHNSTHVRIDRAFPSRVHRNETPRSPDGARRTPVRRLRTPGRRFRRR